MSTVWIVAGLAAVVAIIAAVSSWQRRDQRSELGVVSHQWIAEHRFGQGNDARR